MERRFKKIVLQAIFFGILFFNNGAAPADAVQDKNDQPFDESQSFRHARGNLRFPSSQNQNIATSLEMIAERMKSLSGSLAAIPELPRLNQVIQIPIPENPQSDTKKE